MFYFFAVYCISFLFLSGAVYFCAFKARNMKLTKGFQLLALFGLLHGLKELTELVIWSRRILGATVPSIPLETISIILLWSSFVALLGFALVTLTLRHTSVITLIFPVLYAALVFTAMLLFEPLTFRIADSYGRFMLALPASAASVGAFLVLATKARRLENSKLETAAMCAATAFLAYNAFVAIQEPMMFNVPVLVFRAAAAILIAISAVLFLRGFWP